MNINNISFGKNIQKKQENKFTSSPVQVEDKSTKNHSVSDKIRNKAISYYAAAALGLGSSALTGCVDTESSSTSTSTVDFQALEDFKKMFQQLLESQNQIIAQLQQNNEDNKAIIENLKEQNKLLQDIYNGVVDIKDGVYKLYDIAIAGQENDKEYIAKLDKIIDGQASDNDKLQKILEENQKQSAWLANIQPFIESVANISATTGDTLTKFYEDYKKGNIAHSEFNEKLINAVINNGSISSEVLAEIKGFRADYAAGKISDAELLQKIADSLASIDSKMDVVIGKLNDINGNIVNLSEKVDGNHKETIEKLGDIGDRINNGFSINQSQMSELIQLGKDGNQNTTQVLVEMESLKTIMNEIKEKDGNLKLEELLTKYGDIMAGSFNTVIDLLEENQENDINNVVDIINAINNSKPDLSKIQEQMGTIIVLLQRSQGAGITPEDLQPIVDGLNSLKESNEQGTDAVNNNLSQIIADMSEIKGMLSVMVEVQGEILRTMERYGASAEVSFEQLGSDMKAFLENQLTQEKLEQSLAKFQTDLTQVESSLGQAVVLLQSILDASGNGSEGLTPEQLADVINNSTVLNQIKDLLGNLDIDRVTNTTLNEALSNYRTDTSKIQEQLGTVIILLQNSNQGNVTVDTSKLETAINELVDVVTNQGVTSNTSMNDISNKLQSLINQLTTGTTPASRMVKPTALAQTKMSHNMPYQISLAQIEAAYRQSMNA